MLIRSYLQINQISQVKNEAINFKVLEDLLKGFKIASLLSRKVIRKKQDTQPIQLLLTMFLMIFQDKMSIFEALMHLEQTCKKSTLTVTPTIVAVTL